MDKPSRIGSANATAGVFGRDPSAPAARFPATGGVLKRPALLTLGDPTIQPDAVISNLHEISDLIG